MKKGIEYADKSWNPITGCLNIENGNCSVGKNCWAYKMSHRLKGRFGYDSKRPFLPTFHKERLMEPMKRKKPTRWDSCFMGDIGYASPMQLNQILDVVRKCPQHRFIFLTKLPKHVANCKLDWPRNAWIGVTVNCNEDVWRIDELLKINADHFWVSFEPVYEDIVVSLAGIEWAVIGSQTNPDLQPDVQWLGDIIEHANDLGVPIFLKPNLKVFPIQKPQRELPKELVI